MKLKSSFFIILFLLSAAHAYAFQAEVRPSEINQGDAFVIRVTGALEKPCGLLSDKPFHFNKCGDGCYIALGAVDLEALPGEYAVRLKIGKDGRDLNLKVRKGRFETISLMLPEDKVSLSSEDLKRAEKEAEKLRALWQATSDRLWEGNFIMPLENAMSTPYGAKRIINKKKKSLHRGLDIKGREGEGVKSSNTGRIILAEGLFFGGNTIIIDHGQGIFTIYMHLSGFNARSGDIVSKGDVIGYVGSSGRASGSHLHFGVRVFDVSANPISFLMLSL